MCHLPEILCHVFGLMLEVSSFFGHVPWFDWEEGLSTPSDVLYIRLGTHYVPSSSLTALKGALLETSFGEDPFEDMKPVLANLAVLQNLRLNAIYSWQ
ncbi:hypothetical protein MLD38_014376 [Melastoma candidum]|uniref:Uncharacterized protein n=1 Tax=Melastoma candidum TaxID=119954 RepID=A0ACB9RCI1_9MYRT|nr:hypothetical protein MLD38_014376 [Melastoma candidum]